jgi:alcohol dehydrogenase class IV
LNGSLKTFGILESELSALAKQSMVLPDYTNNPKVPTLEEVRDVLVRSL